MNHPTQGPNQSCPSVKRLLAGFFFTALLVPSAAPAPGQVPINPVPLYQPAPNVTRFAAPSAALADTNGSGLPVVSDPLQLGRPPIYSGASMNPDGKILFTTAKSEAVPGIPGHFLQHKGVFVTHVEHDQITVDPVTGEPDLGSGADTPLTLFDIDNCSSVECPDRQGSVFLTVIDDPTLPDTQTNPYRADCGTGVANLAGTCRLQTCAPAGRHCPALAPRISPTAASRTDATS